MKPPKFVYARPDSVEEALALLAGGGEGTKVLAGGQSLVPLLNLRMAEVAALIDINGLSALSFIALEGGSLRVGALTRHRQLEVSETVRAAQPLLSRAAAEVGHLAIRNRGTVGGSLAHADPAAEWPLVAVTLDAQLVLRSQHTTRTVPARDFFLAPLTTAIEPRELLCEVRFPPGPGQSAWGFQELCRRPGDFALAAVACHLSLDHNKVCTAAAVAVGGAHTVPLWVAEAGEVLRGSRGEEEAVREAAEKAAAAVDPPSDVHASAEYRRRMVKVLTARALREAWARA
ncbi:MAG: xanthine dehydrogenase family protein subunit M [Thermodesulfobacteriota bacterium]|jgi:CO/xanthine dehydrogenase FAD-binding subunit